MLWLSEVSVKHRTCAGTLQHRRLTGRKELEITPQRKGVFCLASPEMMLQQECGHTHFKNGWRDTSYLTFSEQDMNLTWIDGRPWLARGWFSTYLIYRHAHKLNRQSFMSAVPPRWHTSAGVYSMGAVSPCYNPVTDDESASAKLFGGAFCKCRKTNSSMWDWKWSIIHRPRSVAIGMDLRTVCSNARKNFPLLPGSMYLDGLDICCRQVPQWLSAARIGSCLWLQNTVSDALNGSTNLGKACNFCSVKAGVLWAEQ